VELAQEDRDILGIFCRFPYIIRMQVAFPLDKVLEAPAIYLRIQDAFDFKLGFRVDDD
jgi:hypothetical protein